MPRERCQSEQALEAKPSPCITCVRSRDCLVRIAQRNLFEAPKPRVNIVHVVSACDGYASAADADPRRKPVSAKARRGLSVIQSLTSKGVANLCVDCGDSRSCDERHRLDELKRAASANGLKVHFTVVCCSTRPPALIQISEPA